MLKLRSVAAAIAATLGLFAASASHATFVQSTSAAAAGFSTSTSYGFHELGLANGTVVTTQYAGVTFSPYLVQTPQACTFTGLTGACLGNFSPIIDPWEILFSSAQSQAGFNMVTNPGTSVFFAYLGATLVESFTVATNTTSSNNFYGFTGITFDRIRIDTGGSNNAMLMDNLSFNANSVPEPTSLALAGLALAGLGLARKRRAAK